MTTKTIPAGAHTNKDQLMSMLDEEPSSLNRNNIMVIAGFNPRLPMSGEDDPFSEEALADLTASIKAQGILQPLLVRPGPSGKYELIAGERRYHAAGYAGLREVPVLIRNLDDDMARLAAITENGQRLAIPYVQEALMGLRDIASRAGIPLEEAPRLLGRIKNGGDDPHGIKSYLQVAFGETPSVWFQRRAKVLQLTPDECAAVNDRLISMASALQLLKLKDRPERTQLLQRLLSGELNADTLTQQVAILLNKKPSQARTEGPTGRLLRSLPDLEKLTGDRAKRAEDLIQELLDLLK